MAKRKDPHNPDDPEDPQQEDGDPDQRRPEHRPEGREHQVHQEILKRRLRGGPQPTPQDYARALEQWKNLPGSIVRPPTDNPPPPETPPSPDEKPSEPGGQRGAGPAQPNTDEQDKE